MTKKVANTKITEVVLPVSTKEMIDAAFSKASTPVTNLEAVTPVIAPCPVCGQEYEYVLSGKTPTGELWKKFVHDWYWAEGSTEFVAKKVATSSCEMTTNAITLPLKEMIEKALADCQYARKVAPCAEKLTKLFNHAVDKKYVHIFNASFQQVGTAEAKPLSDKEVSLTLRSSSEEGLVIGTSRIVGINDFFTAGKFVGISL